MPGPAVAANQIIRVDVNDQIYPTSTPSTPGRSTNTQSIATDLCLLSLPFVQKLVAELIGTYFLIFAGCTAVEINMTNEKVVTLPGIGFVWGFVVMVMIYSVGHVSGAHFNPAVTIAFASCRRFPLKQVPPYIFAQVLASILASATLRLMFGENPDRFLGTLPSGSDMQSLVIEIIITFYLMFVITAVATDNRAVGELAGVAIGSTVLVIVIFAGPISGASMNPARSIGPAIIYNHYSKLWIYILGPICGAVAGAWAYNIIRYKDKQGDSTKVIVGCMCIRKNKTGN